jgi:hypothetical protein
MSGRGDYDVRLMVWWEELITSCISKPVIDRIDLYLFFHLKFYCSSGKEQNYGISPMYIWGELRASRPGPSNRHQDSGYL